MLGAVVAALFTGFVIGTLARWAVPGPDPMPFWLTVPIGLAGAYAGTGIAVALYGSAGTTSTSWHVFVTLLLEIGVAALLVVLYRVVVQRRPLTGPDAYRFPKRGVGIARMRERLRRLGIDPDKPTDPFGRDRDDEPRR